MKKLHNTQIISKLVVATPLTTITLFMRNFIANFVKIREFDSWRCEKFLENIY